MLDVTDVGEGAELTKTAARERVSLCHGEFRSPVQPYNFRAQGHEDVEHKDPPPPVYGEGTSTVICKEQ